MTQNKLVYVIGTGGTFVATKEKGKPIHEISNIVEKIPEIERISKLKIETLFNIDSSNMQPYMWQNLAEKIYKNYKDVNGIVVTTGTDTLNYTAAALSFMIQNLGKPIVVTGSQVPFEDLGSDARRNFVDSSRVAANADLGEVVTVFNGKIFRGNRTRKLEEERFDAFSSVGYPPLGKVEYGIKLTGYGKKRDEAKEPKLKKDLFEKVFLLKIFPGMSPDIINAIINTGCGGLVIEGFGAGNVPIKESSLIPKIEELINQKIPVVVSTQLADGASWMHRYECGRKALEAGAIPSYDTLSETALVKLMWIMGQTRNFKKIQTMFLTDFVGELSHDMIKNKEKKLVLR